MQVAPVPRTPARRPFTGPLADGFSCGTRIEAGTAGRLRHLADLLPDEEGR
ncbi:hypothetical protein AB0H37_11595 [Actinomadura sp. NPDC023710]|uniref:hypothetical protein n=1 Tax=Actinomadura sp. NPDC023710 TaxID=3158219 RepID=UPI0033F06B84